ncbi:MAG: ribonuclease III [Pseudomonadota bacterium]
MKPLDLGYEFSDAGLLAQALTHRSAGRENYERLEFLGDAILNAVIAEALYHQFPAAPEGDLSRQRARLVRGVTLARVAEELGFAPHLKLGAGERRSGGQRRQSILADALEAAIGAIYLEAGYPVARKTILGWFAQRLENLPSAEALKDHKTRLQELLQGKGMALPQYELVAAEGADHEKVFKVTCQISETGQVFPGEGSSRRGAEQHAAAAALTELAAP